MCHSIEALTDSDSQPGYNFWKYWNLKSLLEIWNLIAPPAIFLYNRSMIDN